MEKNLNKNIVIWRAGMLGSALCPTLMKRKHEVFATDLAPTTDEMTSLDVRSFKHVDAMIKEVKPNIFMHLAAGTDVDRCELESDHAYMTNTIGTQNVAIACQMQNSTMVYISTTISQLAA